MRYLSLFSGIGGFELGMQKAYVEIFNGEKNRRGKKGKTKNVKKWDRLVAKKRKEAMLTGGSILKLPDWKHDERTPHCVGYSEIDKYAMQIYKKHFPKHKNYGDITKLSADSLPKFDLLVGGFPCQSFSIAGKRMGFADTRGTLFFEIARIIKQKQPRLLLLENVKGLLSHNKGNTFATIIATLDELGYDLQWQVLNSKNFGVPQNRERIFIVGHLRGTPRPEVFPYLESQEKPAGKTDKQGCASTLTGRSAGGQNRRGNYIVGTIRNYKGEQPFRKMKSGLSPTLKARARQDGDMQPVIKQDMQIRRLTPIECERLQGFPDNWTKYGATDHMNIISEISDTQRYKTLGNAVTVNVIKAIMEKII